MKPLIRLFLFTVARLGLFLAIVAWIVGQWWYWRISVLPVPGAAFAIDVSICSHGWVFGRMSRSKPRFNATMVPRYDLCPVGWAFADHSPDSLNSNYRIAAGLNLSHVPLVGVGMSWLGSSFRHWLVVTIFGLFYGVLKWVYRKQPWKPSTTQSQDSTTTFTSSRKRSAAVFGGRNIF